jgi:hypothetical protein
MASMIAKFSLNSASGANPQVKNMAAVLQKTMPTAVQAL